eukprot:10173185-Prorocentrum_lima.AAC.1
MVASRSQIESILLALPPRRGAGPDTIPSTPLRQLSPALAPLLEPVYAAFRSTGAVPINYGGGGSPRHPQTKQAPTRHDQLPAAGAL